MSILRILFGSRPGRLWPRRRYPKEVLFAGWVELPALFREIIGRR